MSNVSIDITLYPPLGSLTGKTLTYQIAKEDADGLFGELGDEDSTRFLVLDIYGNYHWHKWADVCSVEIIGLPLGWNDEVKYEDY
jgi:hypothetical protein